MKCECIKEGWGVLLSCLMISLDSNIVAIMPEDKNVFKFVKY